MPKIRKPRSKAVSKRKRLYHDLQRKYPKLGNPLKQANWVGCDCDGLCKPSTCSCLRDGTPCRKSCRCGPECEHQFPPCTCQGPCGDKCPCYQLYYQCTSACGCPNDSCDNEADLPKTVAKSSGIPSAGLGLFADEDMGDRRLIGVMEGKVEPNPDEPDFDCFDIAEGISLRCAKEGIYFVNEKRAVEANAEFRYMEGTRRREMVLRSTQAIKKGEELFAQYSASNKEPVFDVDVPEVGQYALIQGERRDNKGKWEQWVGQIVAVNPHKTLTMQWLLRKEDLDYLPPALREKTVLKPGEHIMVKGLKTGWSAPQTVEWETYMQVVQVDATKPQKEALMENTWWWSKTFDVKKQRFVKSDR